MQTEVTIIGGGAAGLMCALTAARRGRRVVICEHNARAGKKLLVSGGGRCNFSNRQVDASHYFSSNPHFVKSALARFTPNDMTAFLDAGGIPHEERGGGELFCTCAAARLVDWLVEACRTAGVQIRTECDIRSVQRDAHFSISTNDGTIASEALVIATGGLSYPELGAGDFGHRLAKQFGLRVTPCRPALVPLRLGASDARRFGDLSGVSLEARVTCGKRTLSGGLLFTHHGLSGPAILKASLIWENGKPIHIDLLPKTDILASLKAAHADGRRVELKNFLAGMLPRRLAEAWCTAYAPSKPLIDYSLPQIKAIADQLHCWEVTPARTEGWQRAEVTLGGVDTKAISSKTMEARDVPNLFFIGEVLDVTGMLGGYNLHWAWASGTAAGTAV